VLISVIARWVVVGVGLLDDGGDRRAVGGRGRSGRSRWGRTGRVVRTAAAAPPRPVEQPAIGRPGDRRDVTGQDDDLVDVVQRTPDSATRTACPVPRCSAC
jgi:hypothetical protein